MKGRELHGRGRERTWPPENPTATTASSSPRDRNFGWMVGGEVILVDCLKKIGIL